MNYEELVKSLRTLSVLLCNGADETVTTAADAIEELQKAICPHFVRNVHDRGDDSLCTNFSCEVSALPRWIPVTEQLPEDLQNVLVIDEGRVAIGHCEHYYGEEQVYVEWHDTLYYPIDPPFWMPLPEPPKEETE